MFNNKTGQSMTKPCILVQLHLFMLNHKKRRPFGPVKFGEPFDVVWMEKDLAGFPIKGYRNDRPLMA
jgi:hypothetical protein